MENIKQLIEKNDQELKKREDLLVKKVDLAYERAFKEATKEFRDLTKLDANIKPTHEQVKKIVEHTIDAFRKEFEILVVPFQKELIKQYEGALTEAASILASRGEEKKI